MIIWRGWGVLALGYLFLAAMVFGGIASTILDNSEIPFSISIGFTLAALGTWFTGQHLNNVRPRRQIDNLRVELRQHLDRDVANNQFSLGPGYPVPQSRAEAQVMADWYYDQVMSQSKSWINHHTMFWIPMQYFAVVWIGLALFALFTGLTR